MARPRSFDHDAAVATYLADETLSASELGRRLGVTRYAILSALRARGIIPRNPNGTPGPNGIVPPAEFVRLYGEMSVKDLAAHLGCCEFSVWVRAARMGLENPRRRA
jgi:biotin operon repressor